MKSDEPLLIMADKIYDQYKFTSTYFLHQSVCLSVSPYIYFLFWIDCLILSVYLSSEHFLQQSFSSRSGAEFCMSGRMVSAEIIRFKRHEADKICGSPVFRRKIGRQDKFYLWKHGVITEEHEYCRWVTTQIWCAPINKNIGSPLSAKTDTKPTTKAL